MLFNNGKFNDFFHVLVRNIYNTSGGTDPIVPPTGYVFLIDNDNNYLIDNDGKYLIEEE